MSISANFNNTRPSLLLDFANSQQLDPRVTFSRSTTAPYYDGKTSALAEQNLFIQSNTFTNAAWVATSATIASGVTAPDGTATAYSMTATAGNATLYQTLTLTATAYTESIWIQRVTGTGTINLTLDGTTLSPVTITGSWAKYTYTATPSAGSKTIGIQIVTSGDAINIYGSQIENRSSATATNITTTSALTNYIPQLLTAPINAPRFDFNPTTGESLGLLIEQSSTNLLTYSQDFSNASWVKNACSITTGADIAPDGTQTFQKLVEDATTAIHRIQQNYTTTAVGTTLSVYAKQAERSIVYFTVTDVSGTTKYAWFNLATGAVLTVNSGLTGTITSVGNGVYRCSISYTGFAGTSANYIGVTTADGVVSYTGNGTSGVYIWGAQLEALAFPTSYIPTTSAQVTRASDNASMTGTNFSSWYNQGQGTIFTDVSSSLGTSGRSFSIDDGTTANQVAIGYDTSRVRVNSVDIGNFYTTTSIVGKRLIAYSINQQLASNAGASVSSTNNGSLPTTINTLRIGASNAVTLLNGSIKKLAFYPQIVTTSQSQALTGS